MLGCRAFWPDGRHQSTCFRFYDIGNMLLGALCFNSFFHFDRYSGRDFEQEMDVDVVAGCFYLLPREVLEKVGLMDEEFFMYGEEVEWSFRIRKAGWRIRYFPGARIIHVFGGSAQQVQDSTQINKRRAPLLFLDKTGGILQAWIGNLLMMLGVLIRAPYWICIEPFRKGRAKSFSA